jgi:hypothetical protein
LLYIVFFPAPHSTNQPTITATIAITTTITNTITITITIATTITICKNVQLKTPATTRPEGGSGT